MGIFLLLLTLFSFAFGDSVSFLTPNVTVDNGKNNNGSSYAKIQKAIDDAPTNSKYRYVIHIKQGIYNENVTVWKEKPNLTLIGDGKKYTIISSNLSNISGNSIQEATLRIDGSGFLAMNLTVRNNVGVEAGPAVAILSNSPYSAFHRLSIEGYQDTLYIKSGPQFYGECDVYGTVDFIFGTGPAIFQKSQILARQSPPKNKEQKDNAITANGCFHETNATCGFSFHKCNVTGDNTLLTSKSPTPTYLGRPWKNGSRTVFMESYMTWVINSKGWLTWPRKNFENLVFYGEFNNSGKEAFMKNRVNWPGVHSKMDITTARKYTVSEFLNGGKWLHDLGVPHILGLE